MSELYERIESLCTQRGESVTAMCRGSGVSRASLSDLKAGRKQSLSAESLRRIAQYMGISVDTLLGSEAAASEEAIKFALFGGDGEVTDAMYEEVLQFAAYVKQRQLQKEQP